MGTREDLVISSLLSFNVNLGSVIDTSRTFQYWSRYSIRYDEYKVIYSRTDGDSIHSIRTTLSAEYHKSTTKLNKTTDFVCVFKS